MTFESADIRLASHVCSSALMTSARFVGRRREWMRILLSPQGAKPCLVVDLLAVIVSVSFAAAND